METTKSRSKFGIRPLLLAMIPISCAFAAFGYWLEFKKPISWMEYSLEKYDKAIGDGKVVFLFSYADWDMTCKITRRSGLDDISVKRWFRRHPKVVPMWLEFPGNSPESVKLPKRLIEEGLDVYDVSGSHPSFLLSENGFESLVVDDYLNPDRLIRKLQNFEESTVP